MTNNSQAEQLEETLHTLQDMVMEHYCQTGKQLIEVANAEKETIDALVDKIIETRRKLAILREESECPHCGYLNRQSAAYCNRCGKRLQKEATP